MLIPLQTLARRRARDETVGICRKIFLVVAEISHSNKRNMKCWVGDCNHHHTRDKCKYFTIPLTPRKRRRNSWKAAIGNGASPPINARICSCHFKDDDKNAGPTIFKRQRNPLYKHLWVTPKMKTRKPRRSLENFEVGCVDDPSPVDCPNPLGEPSQLKMLSPIETIDGSVHPSDEVHETPLKTNLISTTIESPSGVWEVVGEIGGVCDLQLLKDSPQAVPLDNFIITGTTYCKKNLFPNECKVCCKDPCQCKEELEKQKQSLEEARKLISELYQKQAISAHVIKNLQMNLVLEQNRMLFSGLCDDKVRHYTGLPNRQTFLWLLSLFSKPLNYYGGSTVVSVSKENQLLLTLLKLRHAFTHEVLGDWFKVSEATATRILRTWVSALHTVLFKSAMKNIPSRHKNKKSLPECFGPYPNCRIVIDCTELRVQVPDAIKNKNLVHSSYKGYSTAKGAVAVAPNGTITFASDLYPGSNSDKTIMRECGILDKLQPGDLILADKGFLVNDMLPPGVSLNIPPFKNTFQFTPVQVRNTTSIARARIHVERANARIKQYKILDCIPANMFCYASQLFQTCCALTNLMHALIAEVEDEMRLWQ